MKVSTGSFKTMSTGSIQRENDSCVFLTTRDNERLGMHVECEIGESIVKM